MSIRLPIDGNRQLPTGDKISPGQARRKRPMQRSAWYDTMSGQTKEQKRVSVMFCCEIQEQRSEKKDQAGYLPNTRCTDLNPFSTQSPRTNRQRLQERRLRSSVQLHHHWWCTASVPPASKRNLHTFVLAQSLQAHVPGLQRMFRISAGLPLWLNYLLHGAYSPLHGRAAWLWG